MNRNLIVVIVLLLLSGPGLAASDLNQAAGDVCRCLEAPYDQARKAMALLNNARASGDMSRLASAQGDMMAVINASTLCFRGLSKKYPDIDSSDELKEKVMAIADRQCPNPAAGMLMPR